jgi:hypothetical protein
MGQSRQTQLPLASALFSCQKVWFPMKVLILEVVMVEVLGCSIVVVSEFESIPVT